MIVDWLRRKARNANQALVIMTPYASGISSDVSMASFQGWALTGEGTGGPSPLRDPPASTSEEKQERDGPEFEVGAGRPPTGHGDIMP